MELHLAETHNGITVALRIDAPDAAHPPADVQSAAIDLLEHERATGALLDSAHPELLRLLRLARLAAEQSLVLACASALSEHVGASSAGGGLTIQDIIYNPDLRRWAAAPLRFSTLGAAEHGHADG